MYFLSPVTSRHRDYAWKLAFRLYFSCIDAHCPQWTELHWDWNATVAWLHTCAPLSSFCCSTSFALNQPPPPPPRHTHPPLSPSARLSKTEEEAPPAVVTLEKFSLSGGISLLSLWPWRRHLLPGRNNESDGCVFYADTFLVPFPSGLSL